MSRMSGQPELPPRNELPVNRDHVVVIKRLCMAGESELLRNDERSPIRCLLTGNALRRAWLSRDRVLLVPSVSAGVDSSVVLGSGRTTGGREYIRRIVVVGFSAESGVFGFLLAASWSGVGPETVG